MRDDWDHLPIETDNFKIKLPAGGRTGDLLRKYLLDYAFDNTEENEVFTMCDIDIFFYKKLVPTIEKCFKEKQKIKIGEEFQDKYLDIIFQKETKYNGCNMGVMSMKNNDNVKSFWKEVYEISLGKNLWDQPIMNDILYKNIVKINEEFVEYKKPKVTWGTFDTRVWNWSLKIAHPLVEADEQIILHHANCVVSKKDKIKQIINKHEELIKKYSNIKDEKIKNIIIKKIHTFGVS